MSYGATVLHGCDNSDEAIRHANELFADYRHVEAQFEVVDLIGGGEAIKKVFIERSYDIVLYLAVHHKLKRAMSAYDLTSFIDWLAMHCDRFFVWRGDRSQVADIEPQLKKRGFKRVHYSEICEIMLPQFVEPVAQPAAIWAKTEAVDRPPTK